MSSEHGPAAGERHLVLDDSVIDALYSAATATLRLDLSNKKNVILSFKAKSLGNEPDYANYGYPGGPRNPVNFDGVSISTDRGETWRMVKWLSEVATDWETHSIRMDDYFGWNERFGSDFRIRFSEYDNAPAPLDGIAIDEVLITADEDQRVILELSTTVLEGTGPHTGYVLLALASTNDVTLDLLATPGDQLVVPATVQIAAGQTEASFSFSVPNDDLVNLARTVLVRAEAPNIRSLESAVTILDDDVPVAALALPSQLTEGERPDNNASLSLDRAPDVPMMLTLTANPWGEVELPYGVMVPAGETNVVFTVRAADDNRIDGTVSVVVTAFSPGMVPVTALTEIIDNETRTLSLNLPPTVLEGRATNGMVKLSGTLSTDLQVRLSSANAAALTVPISVTIPAGWSEAEFSITAVDNLFRDGNRPVIISALASTFTENSGTITIRDNEVATYRFGGLSDIMDIGRPVAITVSAADGEGNAISGFTGSASLSVVLPDGSIQPVAPPMVHLTGATGWAGNITLPSVSASPLHLRATDASGNAGNSITFDTMRVLDLTAADLLWDPTRGRLYASVPADAGGTNANKVVVIDPANAEITASMVIAQSPGKLALTSGGENLYVALDGNGTIARINLATWSIELTFPVGTDPLVGTLFAADLCAVAGQPDLLVVSRSRSIGYGHHSVAAYDHGVARPTNTFSYYNSSSFIEPSADPGIFFGYSSDTGLRRLRLDAAGIIPIEMNPPLIPGSTDIRSDGDKVFSTSGVEADGAQMRRLGSFPVRGPVCPDLAANRVYFLEQQDFDWNSIYDKVGVYDPATFSNLRRLTLSVEAASPRSFVRWGTNGLAFITETNIVLISSSRLVPSEPPANLAVTVNATPNPATVSVPLLYTVCVSNQGPNPAGDTFLTIVLSDSQEIQSVLATIGVPLASSNTVTLDVGELAVGARATLTITTLPDSAGSLTCSAGATSGAFDPDFTDNAATKAVRVGFRQVINTVNRLRLAANNLIYDPTRNLLWASLRSTAEAPFGRTIVSIDPTTGLFSEPIPINGYAVAQCMALSANGRYLYVGLSETNEVHRIDLSSPVSSLRIPLGPSQWGGANSAQDIEPLDGDGTSFLMTGGSDRAAAVYDGVVRRRNRTDLNSVDRIERTGTPGVFVGYSSGNQISSLAVTAAGVTNTRQVGNVISGYGVEIRGAGNLVLSSTGLLVDSTNLTLNASFGVLGKPCLDLPNQRAHLLNGNILSSFDTTTLLPVGDFTLPFTSSEDWSYGWSESCIRWGLDGFAFLEASGDVHIWRWSEAIPASVDANADGISDAWEAAYFGVLAVDPAGDDDGDGLLNFMEYVFVTSPVQASANPVQASATTVGDQTAIRLVFPRRAGLSPRPYEYAISSDLTLWTDALNVSETVLSTQNVDGIQIETVQALMPASNPIAGFVRFRWNPH